MFLRHQPKPLAGRPANDGRVRNGDYLKEHTTALHLQSRTPPTRNCLTGPGSRRIAEFARHPAVSQPAREQEAPQCCCVRESAVACALADDIANKRVERAATVSF